MSHEIQSNDQPQPTAAPQPASNQASETGLHFAILGVAATAQYANFSKSSLNVFTLPDHIAAFQLVRSNPQALLGMLSDLAVLAHGQASAAIMTSAGKPMQIAELHARIATKYMAEARNCTKAVYELMGALSAKRDQTEKPAKPTTAVQANVECVIAPTVQCLIPGKASENTEEESLTQKLEANPHLSFAEIIGMPPKNPKSKKGDRTSEEATVQYDKV